MVALKRTGRAIGQEVLGLWVEIEVMKISFTQRQVDSFVEWLEA